MSSETPIAANGTLTQRLTPASRSSPVATPANSAHSLPRFATTNAVSATIAPRGP